MDSQVRALGLLLSVLILAFLLAPSEQMSKRLSEVESALARAFANGLAGSGHTLPGRSSGAHHVPSRQIPHRSGRTFAEIFPALADSFADIFTAFASFPGCAFLLPSFLVNLLLSGRRVSRTRLGSRRTHAETAPCNERTECDDS
jgi:hypothetical protein